METKTYESIDTGSSQSLLESMYNLEPTPDPLEQFKATPVVVENLKAGPEILDSTAEIDSSWTEIPELSHTGKIDRVSATMKLDDKEFLGGQAIIDTLLAKGSYTSTFADTERGVIKAAEYTVSGQSVTLRIYERAMDIFVDTDSDESAEQLSDSEQFMNDTEQAMNTNTDDIVVSTASHASKRRLGEQRSSVGDGRIIESIVTNKEVAKLSQETGIHLTFASVNKIIDKSIDSGTTTDADSPSSNEWQAIAA